MAAFRKSDAKMMTTAWELSAGMLSFVIAIGIGYWVGLLLDGQFGTSPWLKAIFLSLGFIAGVLNVYRTVSRAVKRPSSGPAIGDRTGETREERGRR